MNLLPAALLNGQMMPTPESPTDAVLADLLPPGGLTEDTALVILCL
jgi:hypothetical protein